MEVIFAATPEEAASAKPDGDKAARRAARHD